ncbi:BPL-N domain-containing protein [Micavibrio aeruginosavorus]|uniref:BPL-N domain-containing protein n=1 Tax=Micavibrio aeruginosavorus TaxID=349221 RepID=UPI003F4A896C
MIERQTMTTTPRILVYEDYVHNNAQLHRALRDAYGPFAVTTCDAGDLQTGILNKSVNLFIMPGGADLYNCEKLNGAGNKILRHYVEEGGAYLGLCAGAYYASRDIKWAEGIEGHAIMGPRELNFFLGTAVGPVMDFIEDRDITKSWNHAAQIEWLDDMGNMPATVHYNGGPVFVGAEDAPGTKILARYTSLPGSPAAIIECSVGKGHAILCSPHLEHGATTLSRALYNHANPSFNRRWKIIDTLIKGELSRKMVWDSMMKRALTPQKTSIAA